MITKKYIAVVSALTIASITLLFRLNTSGNRHETEPDIAAANSNNSNNCVGVTLLPQEALSFGSMVGSTTKGGFISVATNGEVTQSGYSEIGSVNTSNLSSSQTTQAGQLSLTGSGLKPGSRLSVRLPSTLTEPGYSVQNLHVQAESLLGLQVDSNLSTQSQLVLKVDENSVSGTLLLGGILHIDSGVSGAISLYAQVTADWVCE